MEKWKGPFCGENRPYDYFKLTRVTDDCLMSEGCPERLT